VIVRGARWGKREAFMALFEKKNARMRPYATQSSAQHTDIVTEQKSEQKPYGTLPRILSAF